MTVTSLKINKVKYIKDNKLQMKYRTSKSPNYRTSKHRQTKKDDSYREACMEKQLSHNHSIFVHQKIMNVRSDDTKRVAVRHAYELLNRQL